MEFRKYRYGFYARPDLALSKAQIEVHTLLERQYGLKAAGKFMPHATVKGFFLSQAEPGTMIDRLSAALEGLSPFVAHNNGVHKFGPHSLVIVSKFLPDRMPNMAWFELQNRAWDALLPLVHPECEFTPRDGRGLGGSNPFIPHFTLAMADLPTLLQEEVSEFVLQGGTIGPSEFKIEALQLFRFEADWDGKWWETLEWELLHSWWKRM